MGSFLYYSIRSGLMLLAMYLAFKLTLATEKQHGYNRAVILTMYAIAFLGSPIYCYVKNFTSKYLFASDSAESIALTELPTVVETGGNSPIWGTILIWIYIAGMVIVGAMTLITWARIVSLILSGERIKNDGYTLILTDDTKLAPFSWMRYMVINRRDYALCGETITIHELRHIRACHWMDLLIAQVVVIINWFNPAAWLTREELMLIHEYQADMAVIESGCNRKEYQLMLIEKAVGARFPSLANSLNHSNLKRRITMMYKEKSSQGRRLRALALVPADALVLVSTSIPQVRAALVTIDRSSTSIGKVMEISAKSSKSDVAESVAVAAKPATLKAVTPAPTAAKSNEPKAKTPKVTAFSNDQNGFTIDLEVPVADNGVAISSPTFTSDGQEYYATSTQMSRDGEKATAKIRFPSLQEFANSSILSLDINGEKVTIDVTATLKSLVKDGGRNAKVATEISSLNMDMVENGVAYIHNGRQISHEEMNQIDPASISSVRVSESNGIKVFILD